MQVLELQATVLECHNLSVSPVITSNSMEVHNMHIKYRASQHLQILPTLVNLVFFVFFYGRWDFSHLSEMFFLSSDLTVALKM